jgi:uncharacterized membrane-anchored protein
MVLVMAAGKEACWTGVLGVIVVAIVWGVVMAFLCEYFVRVERKSEGLARG